MLKILLIVTCYFGIFSFLSLLGIVVALFSVSGGHFSFEENYGVIIEKISLIYFHIGSMALLSFGLTRSLLIKNKVIGSNIT